MRDLREELSQRVAELLEERKALQSRLEEIAHEEGIYRRALAIEERRWARMQPRLPMEEAPEGDRDLRDFVEFLLRGRPMGFEEIRDTAMSTGILHDSPSPGRSVQGVLAGLAKLGRIAKSEDGLWYWLDLP